MGVASRRVQKREVPYIRHDPPTDPYLPTIKMDTWETHYRVSESGASRSLIGIDLTDVDIAYTGHLVANEHSATLVASGSTNFRDISDDQAEQEDECVSHAVRI